MWTHCGEQSSLESSLGSQSKTKANKIVNSNSLRKEKLCGRLHSSAAVIVRTKPGKHRLHKGQAAERDCGGILIGTYQPPQKKPTQQIKEIIFKGLKESVIAIISQLEKINNETNDRKKSDLG